MNNGSYFQQSTAQNGRSGMQQQSSSYFQTNQQPQEFNSNSHQQQRQLQHHQQQQQQPQEHYSLLRGSGQASGASASPPVAGGSGGTSPNGSQHMPRLEGLSLADDEEQEIIAAVGASQAPLGIHAPTFEGSGLMAESRKAFHAAANAAMTLHTLRQAAFTEAKVETLTKVCKIVAQMAQRDQLNGHIRLSELFPAIGCLAPEPRTAPTTPQRPGQQPSSPRRGGSSQTPHMSRAGSIGGGSGQTLNGQELESLAEAHLSETVKQLASMYRLQKDCFNEGIRYALQLVMDAVSRITHRDQIQGYIGLNDLLLELRSMIPASEGGEHPSKKPLDAPLTQQLNGRISGCKRSVDRREEDDVPSFVSDPTEFANLQLDADALPPPFSRRRLE